MSKLVKKNNSLGDEQDYSIEKLSKSLDEVFKGHKVHKEDLLREFESVRLTKKQINSLEIYDLLINQSLKMCNLDNDMINLEWRFVASKLLMKKTYKVVAKNRGYNKLHKYSDYYSFVTQCTELGLYDSQLIDNYTQEEIVEFAKNIYPDFDLGYDYAGMNSLISRYLIKKNGKSFELPQEMYLSLSLLLAIPEKKENRIQVAKEIYNIVASRKISLATPILLNLRVPNGNLASCFIGAMSDSLDSIYHTLDQLAQISKNAGGVGVNISRIRSSGSYIRGVKGASSGIMPWVKLINDTGIAVNQQGKRAGAITVALDMWHLDIEDFLHCQTENGDLRKKTFDIFPQVVVPDLFMQRVENNGDWTLVDPNEIKRKYGIELTELYGIEFENLYSQIENDITLEFKKTIKAKNLFKIYLKTVVETGMPYMFFKDTVNETNPNKHVGMVGNSNLCVAPNTRILTRNGHQRIVDLVDQEIELWNGNEWSLSKIFKTSDEQKVNLIKYSDGSELICTDYHRHPILDNQRNNTFKIVETKDLKHGDKLIKFDLPIIDGDKVLHKPYENGFFTGDGSIDCNLNPQISLYGDKIKLINKFECRLIGNYEPRDKRQRIVLYKDLMPKYFVPDCTYTITSRLQWLAGILDSDGTLGINGNNEALLISSINNNFLMSIKLMLQTLGIDSKVSKMCDEGLRFMPDHKGGQKEYFCQTSYRLIISSINTYNLYKLGLNTFRIKYNYNKPQRDAKQFVKIKSVEDYGLSDTYCFTEPKRNMGIFNGILSMNCTESWSNFKPSTIGKKILNKVDKSVTQQVTSGEVHVCSLISQNLSLLNDEDLEYSTSMSVRIIDNLIDLSTNPIVEAELHNFLYRIIGVGSMGLHDYLVKKKSSYKNASGLVSKLYESIAYYGIKASMELAKERGTYGTCDGSEWSKGIVFGKDKKWFENNETFITKDKWLTLLSDLQQHGIRNGGIFAIAPNCQDPNNKIQTNDGIKSIYDIFNEQNIKVKDIEEIGIPVWVNLETPVAVPTYEGNAVCERIWYNGQHETIDIEFEDSNVYSYTPNHKLLVNRNGVEVWIRCDELSEEDDIVNV